MRSAISGKVFKNGPSKICGRRPLKNLKGYGYGLLKHFSGILIYLIYLKQSPRVVLEKRFPKFRGKHLCQSLLFIKLQASNLRFY